MEPEPKKTDQEDMSRPGPIAFVLMGGAVLAYVVIAHGTGILGSLGLR